MKYVVKLSEAEDKNLQQMSLTTNPSTCTSPATLRHWTKKTVDAEI